MLKKLLIVSLVIILTGCTATETMELDRENFVSKVEDPGILQEERFLSSEILSREEIEAALDYIITKIDENLPRFTHKFPSGHSENLMYKETENNGWTNSFWTGMLWLAYEYTGDEKYLDAAKIQCESFRERLEKNRSLEHHDLGFLYTLSCIKGYKMTGDERLRETAVMAADKLIKRYHEHGRFIQVWGKIGDKSSYHLIVDSMMNLELLYWASEITGDGRYYDAAYNHAKTTAMVAIRPDGSTYHLFFFDPKTGKPTLGRTKQGFSDSSPWARGQAWAVYGFPISYKYTEDKLLLEESVKITNFFLNKLPEDFVCYWDLSFTSGSEEKDSSAAAIAACGLLESNDYCKTKYSDVYFAAANAILRSLTENYTTKGIDSNGILLHGVLSKPQNTGVDECMIFGDYYYMEGLMRLYNMQQ